MDKYKRIYHYIKLLLLRDGYKRAEYIKKKKIFYKIGRHCYFWPVRFGTEPWLITMGDNVHVATGVSFVNHDITSFMFGWQDHKEYTVRVGSIEIGNNVFIGCNSTILYDTVIEDNVIIAAGSLVTGNIPGGSVVGGVPAKVIGDYDSYREKIVNYTDCVPWSGDEKNQRLQEEWFWNKYRG